jgi:hypothetical protein
MHLTAGLLFVGFRSVVGTIWPIADDDGPLVTEQFYTTMFSTDNSESWYFDSTFAAHAMRTAIRTLRDKKVPLSRWVPFIHMGI